jgi:8-oxo-dGTP pyrophosphatase MutT (NUDIX family)
MAQLVYGERIAKTAKIRTGCAAILFDDSRQKILLTKRSDNGRWCLPGGGLDAGESATEACERELFEETGLRVKVKRLTGIYSDPHMIVQYGDGNRWQILALTFEVEVIGGMLGLSNETLAADYFSRDEMNTIDVMEHHLIRIDDALANREAAFVR